MKSVFAALVLLASASAMAMPAVGDKANYTAKYERGGQSMDFTASNEIVSFDKAKSAYTIKSTSVINGQTQENTDVAPANEMVTDALVADILAKCSQYGGTAESVTVPAGTFNACALSNDDQGNHTTTWIAPVAFGAVKQVSKRSDGSVITAILASFQFGK